MQNARQPFYKFTRPCDHVLCRAGDTWVEELGMTRHEFETARGRIAARTHGDVDPTAFISYWTTSGHRVTWYAINETLLVDQLSALYPTEQAAVGVQLPIPTAEPFPKMPETAIPIKWKRQIRKARKRHCRKVETAAPSRPSANARNAIAGFQRQKRTDDDLTELRSEHQNHRQQQHHHPRPNPPPAPLLLLLLSIPVPAILDWIGFDDTLTEKERQRSTRPPACSPGPTGSNSNRPNGAAASTTPSASSAPNGARARNPAPTSSASPAAGWPSTTTAAPVSSAASSGRPSTAARSTPTTSGPTSPTSRPRPPPPSTPPTDGHWRRPPSPPPPSSGQSHRPPHPRRPEQPRLSTGLSHRPLPPGSPPLATLWREEALQSLKCK